MDTPIQKFIDGYYGLYNYLMKQEEISLSVEINEHYRKILLLSCASYYESQIIQIVKEFVKSNTKDERLTSFVNCKAINRQYHTYFQWNNRNNINNFLDLFGSDFKTKVSQEIQNNADLSNQVNAFLEIGEERNKMVHENFLEYRLEKTFDEIINLHKNALSFIHYLKSKFE